MPFVQLHVPSTVTDDGLQRAGQAVHEALVATFDVPPDDRFQLLQRHAAPAMVCTPAYLGIAHGTSVAFVQVVCKGGRTVAQKCALYRAIADGVARATGLRADDVVIHVVENRPEDWSFGGGLASLVTAAP